MRTLVPRDSRGVGIAVSVVVVLVVGGLLNLPGASANSQAGVAAQVGVAGPARAIVAPQVKGRTLRVTVGALPSGRRTVEVRGPSGFRKTLRKSTTLRRLTPGRYRISAATVTTKRFMAKAKVSKRRVRVTNKRGARVKVSYPVAVSTALEVIKPGEVKSFAAPLDGTGKLVTTKDLSRGDIVAAGVGASTPEGMLVKVTSVVSTGRKSTYKVTQARIDEALPQGSFDTAMTADLAPPTSARHSLRGRESFKGALGCTVGGGDPSISPEGGIAMRLSGSWGADNPSVSVTLTPYAEAKIKAFVGAQVACKKEISIFDRKFTPITTMIGPVPFVIVPRLRMLAGADLNVVAGLSVDAQARLDATLAATAAGSGFKTHVTGPTVTRSATIEMQGNASADLYARARFTGDIYGVGGPYGQVRVGVKGRADIAANPWWNLEAYARAGIGVEIDKCAQVLASRSCLSLSAGKDDLIAANYPIANAGGPFTPTPPGTGILVAANSEHPRISSDAQHVAFVSHTSSGRNVFVWERAGRTSTRIVGRDDTLSEPSISSDGRYVAYTSGVVTLDPYVADGISDVFVWDRTTGESVPVTSGNNDSHEPSISADGRFVAFSSAASNIVEGDTNANQDIFLWDRNTGITTRVAGGERDSVTPNISADGRYVTFTSSLSYIVAPNGTLIFDVFVWDRMTGATIAIPSGPGSNSLPSISGNGQYVAYQSTSYSTTRSQNVGDIFLWNRGTGSVTRVTDGIEQGFNRLPTISADGDHVTFMHYDAGGSGVFVWDRGSGKTTHVSASTTSHTGRTPASISADGGSIAFNTAYDQDGATHVRVWDRVIGGS